jgi:Zn-dependent peptidase ImmA (M78 family)
MKQRINIIQIPELEKEVGIFFQHEWREDEEKIIEKYYGRMDSKKLAKYFDVSPNALAKKAHSMGLSYRDAAREMQHSMKQKRKK